jgi:hypothetical protein
MKEVHKPRPDNANIDVEIETLVLRYGPIPRRLFNRSVHAIRGYEIVLGFLLGIAAAILIAVLFPH